MRALLIAVVAFLVTGTPSLGSAEFEGLLVSKVSGAARGTTKVWVSKHGLRNEAEMELPAEVRAQMGGEKTHRVISIVKASEPNLTYLIDEQRKTYSVMDHRSEATESEEKYRIERKGKDKVAGFSCDKVVATDARGFQFELCMAPGLIGGSFMTRALEQRKQGQGLLKAMADVGVTGYPARWVHRPKDGTPGMTMELVSAEKRSVPASTFAIPAGYTKTEGIGPGGIKATGPADVNDALKNLPPDQRKRIEEMMKKYGGSK